MEVSGQQQQQQQSQQQPGPSQQQRKHAPRQAGALSSTGGVHADAAAAAATAAASQAIADRKRITQRTGAAAGSSANASGSNGHGGVTPAGAHAARSQRPNRPNAQHNSTQSHQGTAHAQQGTAQIQQGTYEYQQPHQAGARVLPHQPFQFANNFTYHQQGHQYSSHINQGSGYARDAEQGTAGYQQNPSDYAGHQQRGRGRGGRGRGGIRVPYQPSQQQQQQFEQQPAGHQGEVVSHPGQQHHAGARASAGPASSSHYVAIADDAGGQGGRGRGRGRGKGRAAPAHGLPVQESTTQAQQAPTLESVDHATSAAAQAVAAATGLPQQQRRQQRQHTGHDGTAASVHATPAEAQAGNSVRASAGRPAPRRTPEQQPRLGRLRREAVAPMHLNGTGAEQSLAAQAEQLTPAGTADNSAGADRHKPSRGVGQRNNRQQGPTAVGPRRRQQLPSAALDSEQAGQHEEDSGHTVTCCVCFQDVQAISVGACNHWEVCAQCCLRLRLLFKDNRCPMCKSDNQEVVLLRPPASSSSMGAPDKDSTQAGKDSTPANKDSTGAGKSSGNQPSLSQTPGFEHDAAAATAVSTSSNSNIQTSNDDSKGGIKDDGMPDFQKLMAEKDKLWMQPRWAKGVYVQSFSPGFQGIQRPLHVVLQRMTARACAHCDPSGARPFMTDKQLQDHVLHNHGLQLCQLCMAHGHKFALEAQLFTQKELVAHQKSTHPRCKFCQTNFYGTDELFHHMQHEHFYCHVCRRARSEYVYFRDMDKLVEHFRSEHYLCEEPECAGCQTAFSTQEELIIHYHQRHPKRMPQWDTARGRPLVLDLTSALLSASVEGTGRPPTSSARRGRQGDADRQHRQPPRLGDVVESTGGLTLIDDQEQIGADDGGAVGGTSRGGPTSRTEAAPRAFGSWATAGLTRPSGAPHAEEFPSLQAAVRGAAAAPPAGATASLGSGSSSNGTSAAAALAAAPPVGLRKVTVHCPCGRRSYHLALRAGQAVPPLACDRECERTTRRHALAEAFGVSDPDHHVSYWDRQGKDVNWAPALLQAAQQEPAWITLVEGQIAGFVADAGTRRLVMDPMTSRQRSLVHQLAEAYGLATSATGHEPHRRIQLLKTAATAAPRTSLMAASATVSVEEVEALLASQFSATEAAKLKLVDVAPGVNVAHYFRDWADHCTISQPTNNTAIVTFTKESAMKSALATLGGGIRGVFRIERPVTITSSSGTASQRPSTSSQSAAAGAALARHGQEAGNGWLSINRRGRGGAVVSSAGQLGRTAVRTASGSIRSVVDPWLTEDEAALAEREATEAAIRAAAANHEEFVFDSWEEQVSNAAVSVFPASHAASDMVRGAADARMAGGSLSAAAAGALLAQAPLPLEATQWEVLDGEEAAPDTQEVQAASGNDVSDDFHDGDDDDDGSHPVNADDADDGHGNEDWEGGDGEGDDMEGNGQSEGDVEEGADDKGHVQQDEQQQGAGDVGGLDGTHESVEDGNEAQSTQDLVEDGNDAQPSQPSQQSTEVMKEGHQVDGNEAQPSQQSTEVMKEGHQVDGNEAQPSQQRTEVVKEGHQVDGSQAEQEQEGHVDSEKCLAQAAADSGNEEGSWGSGESAEEVVGRAKAVVEVHAEQHVAGLEQ